jgi:hypothetical protein
MPTFIEVLQPAVVDAFILARGRHGPVFADEVERMLGAFEPGLDLVEVPVRDRLEALERNGHLRREGTHYVLTDDGREDVERVLPWLRQVVDKAGPVTVGMRLGEARPAGTRPH